MFFVFGISNKEKEIDFSQTTICRSCGAYGRLEMFVKYTYFSLFFIPIFKWNRKYYVRSNCCNSLYSLDKEIGRNIEKGYEEKIDESDLKPVDINYNKRSYCGNCNFPIESEFEFCPKCGNKL